MSLRRRGLHQDPGWEVTQAADLVIPMSRPPTKQEILETLRQALPYLRQKYGVVRLGLFGSFAKQTPRPDSDVDLLVELEKPLGLEFVSLADELEQLLGRKVDLATFDAWKRTFATHRRAIAEDVGRSLVYVP